MDATAPRLIGSLLVADPEQATCALLQANLARHGWEVLLAHEASRALEILAQRAVDLAIVDIRLPDMHGVEVLQRAQVLRPGLPVIATAPAATVQLAVEAMQAGAVTFIPKPFNIEALEATIETWASLRPDPSATPQLGGCTSVVPAVAAVLKEAAAQAGCDGLVAICGAPGTGRKTLAAAMHQASGRPGPLQTVDAALLPADQLRTCLAKAIDCAGSQGAVLIAEAQQIKLSEQEPLTRLLATHANTNKRFYLTLSDTPQRLLAAGKLAKGLIERLAGSSLPLPPLAARPADIPLLTRQIVEQAVPSAPPSVTARTMRTLVQYDWPGNIRQLRLVLERAARMAGPGAIEPRHLPILQAVQREPVPMGWTSAGPINLQEIVENVERQLIESALQQTGRNQAKAAELLGVPRTTLRDKLDKYGFTAAGRARATEE